MSREKLPMVARPEPADSSATRRGNPTPSHEMDKKPLSEIMKALGATEDMSAYGESAGMAIVGAPMPPSEQPMSNKRYENLEDLTTSVRNPHDPSDTTTTTTPRKLTHEEQSVVAGVVQTNGMEWAHTHVDLILGQFYSI